MPCHFSLQNCFVCIYIQQCCFLVISISYTQAQIRAGTEAELTVTFTPSFHAMNASLLSAVTRGASAHNFELPITLQGLLSRELPQALKRTFRRVVAGVASKAKVQVCMFGL